MVRFLVTFPLLVALGCAHSGGQPAAENPDAVRAAIAEANRQLAQALIRGDAAAIASLFTETGQIIPFAAKGTVDGRAAIEAYNSKRFQTARITEAVLTSVNIGTSGDLAYETGTNRVTRQQGDAAPVTATGRYLAVWHHDADGKWRIQVDMPIPDPAP